MGCIQEERAAHRVFKPMMILCGISQYAHIYIYLWCLCIHSLSRREYLFNKKEIS